MAEYYSDETIRRVRSDADIRFCIPGADTTKATSYVPCPKCGATGKNKGLCVTHKGRRNMAKCFRCDFTLNDAVAATMFYECNDIASRFPEAIKKTLAGYISLQRSGSARRLPKALSIQPRALSSGNWRPVASRKTM